MNKINAAVALFLQNEHMLIQKRQREPLRGYWEFPGGKVKSDETAEQALIRECLEEINTQPISYTYKKDILHEYAKNTLCLKVYFIHHWHGTPSANEGQELRWVPLKEKVDKMLLPCYEIIRLATATG